MSSLNDRQDPSRSTRVPISALRGTDLDTDTSAPPARTAFRASSEDSGPQTADRQTQSNMAFILAMFSGNDDRQREERRRRQDQDMMNLVTLGITRRQLETQGEISQGDILNASRDADTQSLSVGVYTDPNTGTPRYFTGGSLDQASRIYGNTGSDNWRMTNIGDLQRDMVSGIQYASRVTGVPASLLGAMAGIESGFGRNQMSPTGAEGIFQQTDGYLRQWYINNSRTTLPKLQELNRAMGGSDRILNAALADGNISRAEANRLAYSPAASALITGLAAQAMARRTGIDLNDRGNWWMVYAEHNVGAGGLNALRSGGRPAQWIQDANPAFYRGGDPRTRYANEIERFAGRFERSFGNMLDNDGPSTRLASAGPAASAPRGGAAPSAPASAGGAMGWLRTGLNYLGLNI